MFTAGIRAYEDYKQNKPSGYAISLDACSSGLQILACLSDCEKSALNCGVISTGNREDAYKNLYNKMKESSQTIKDNIKHKDIKQAIMTALYNSEEEPRKVCGEGEALDVFYKTLETEIPGAWELNMFIRELWNPKAYSYDWVLPDNFHVHIPVEDFEWYSFNFNDELHTIKVKTNKPSKTGRSLGANITHSIDGLIVREIVARCSFDIQKQIELINYIDSTKTGNNTTEDQMVVTLWNHFKESGFLSARILKYLNKDNMGLVDNLEIGKLIQSMPYKSFDVLTVHDCFKVLPNYGNDLRKQYNIILSNIAKSDMLQYIINQFSKTKFNIYNEKLIYNEIIDADYALS